jgi:pectinesterase
MKIRIILIILAFRLGLSVQAAAVLYDLIVAQDGSGDYTTIQAAINAVPDYRKVGPTHILIKAGLYKEKIVIAASKE